MMKSNAHKRGFTLVELMVSIAMVVILMLGITRVFSLTSQTASATNQLADSLRDGRAGQSTFAQDFGNALGEDAPCIILHSTALPAFRNRADMESDRDYNASDTNVLNRWNQILTVDLDADNLEGETGEVYPATYYNDRNHRLDTFSFFTRQRLNRQTGGEGVDGALIDPMTADEAWVWYGHLWLPDNDFQYPDPTGTFASPIPSDTFPGQATAAENPNNFFASQWILGRVAILLREPDPTGAPLALSTTGDPLPMYVHNTTLPVSPLQAGSPDSRNSKDSFNNPVQLEDSRYDIAATSIDRFRLQLYDLTQSTPGFEWWLAMMGGDYLPTPSGPTGGRFKANPFVASAINPETLAKQSPIFLRGCTQFIVEFAGDYFQQVTDSTSPRYGHVTNAYLNIDPATAAATDGQIDFIIKGDTNGNGIIDSNEIPTREIRWYGMPRNSDDNGAITGWVPNRTTTLLTDVLPIRDVLFSGISSPDAPASWRSALDGLRTAVTNPLFRMPFERTDFGGPYDDYRTLGPGAHYICAWGPTDRKPKMIRIRLTIDDPASKLADGQTFEYVFSIP